MSVLKRKDISRYKKELLQENHKDPITNHPIKDIVLDHRHSDGYCRGLLDRETNQYLGKLEQNFIRFIRWKFPGAYLPDVLRKAADYLERDPSGNPLHPGWAESEVKKFNRKTKKQQCSALGDLSLGKIVPGITCKARTKQFRDWLYSNENLYYPKIK